MIAIKRSDGQVLTLSAAKTTMETRSGLVVEMAGDEYYIIPDFSFAQLEEFCEGTWRALTIILKEWKGWNVKR